LGQASARVRDLFFYEFYDELEKVVKGIEEPI
jgi:hypothetical protein